MKAFSLALAMIVIAICAAWPVQPWMSCGHTFQIGSWKYGNYEFQVWQRKNPSFWEPFSTAIFARNAATPDWQAFSLGFQDCYQPRIVLRIAEGRVEVFHEQRRLGDFDLVSGDYFRIGQTKSIGEGTTKSPQAWWYAPKTMQNRNSL